MQTKTLKKGGYILWLASWYPDRFEPLNGDFIQRNAVATAAFIPVTVFHFVQSGSSTEVPELQEATSVGEHLTEYIVYPKHWPLKQRLLNKLIYNWRFYRQARKRLSEHFRRHGLPAGVHVHIPLKAGNLALWIKRQWGIGYLVSEHSGHYLASSPEFFAKKPAPYRWQVARVCRQALQVTNVSAAVSRLMEQLLGLPEVKVIHNLADTRLFYYQPEQHTVFTFIHVSVMNGQKNIFGLLEAFERLAQSRSGWQLLLVGPAGAAVRDRVAGGKLAACTRFTGEIPYEQVAEQMRHAHCLALFSRYENFPCVVVEALCCGLPVVSSDVAGIAEAVNGNNGLLVKEGDVASLTAALRQVLDNYESYDRQAIAAAAASRFSAPVIGKEIFNLYHSHFGVFR